MAPFDSSRSVDSASTRPSQGSLTDELAHRLESYRDLLDSVPTVVWRANAQTAQFTFVSAYAEALLGYPLETWLNEPSFWQDHIHPDDREWVIAACSKSTQERRTHDLEYRMIALDGRAIWVRDICSVISVNDQPTELIGVLVDITETKRAQQALKSSEDYLRQVVDTIPQEIWSGPADGTLDFCNARWLANMGLSLDQIQGNGWQQILHPDDLERVLRAWSESVRTGTVYEHQERHRIASGEYRWRLCRAVPLRGEHGRIVRWFGSNTDIDDQKQAEDALRKSEERWQAVFENSAIGVALTDQSGCFLAANSAYQKMLGYTGEELGRLTFLELTHEEYRESNWQLVTELFEGKRRQFQIEKQYRRKDGSLIWVSNNVSLVPGTESMPRFVMALAEDITERKHAEEKLRRSEARIRRLVEANIIGIIIWNLEGQIIDANEVFLRMVGYDREDLLSNRVRWKDLTPAEWQHRDARAIDELRATGVEQPYEKEYFRKDGSRVAVLIGAATFAEDSNEGVAFVVDITERKRAEEALRASEQRWRGAFENTNVGVGLQDASLRFIDVNEAFCQMVGYTRDELRQRTCLDITYEEDREKYKALIDELLDGKRPRFDFEKRYRKKNGELIWARLNGSVVSAADGPLWVVIEEDITAEKKLRDKLQQERDRLRLLLDLNKKFASKLDLHDFFHALSITLREIEGWENSFIALPQSADQLMINLVGPGMFELSVGTSLPVEGTFAGNVYRSGRPEFFRVADLGPVPAHPQLTNWRASARAAGLQTGWNLPLLYDGKVLGVLGFHSRRDPGSARADLPFLEELAKLVAIALHNALRYGELNESNEKLSYQKEYLEAESLRDRGIAGIVGASPVIAGVIRQIDAVAPTDSTVLITGETGTGKELLARAIHERSPRRNYSFIKVDCAAIPATLMESELFGHEKGAFTGATARKLGRFEIADKGTLFLDEVGDIPLELQTKLLRVLQDHAFERLGSNRTATADVRIVAATHRNLEEMVEKGLFREDLYYRLKVFPIMIPPLRGRRSDIPVLVRHYVETYARRMKKEVPSVPAATMDAFMRYPWPGNVRELQHFIERSMVLTSGQHLQAPLSELKRLSERPAMRGLHGRTMEEVERETILEALQQANWVIGGPDGAAAKLGLKRTTLASRMEKLGISRPR